VLQVRIVQLSLLAWVAFGTVANLLSAPLAAEVQQDVPATIPDLSSYDRDTRQSIELACIVKKSDGPVAYGACLNRQVASLQGSPGIPGLSGYDRETRQSIELACIVKKSDGPVAYGACLNQQIASLHGSPGIPRVGGYDGETGQTTLPTSTSGDESSFAPGRAPAVQSVGTMSRFSSENVLKVHQGMSSKKVLEMFGAPKNVSQSVCGGSVGKPWACTT
jgi:hypothetical protein